MSFASSRPTTFPPFSTITFESSSKLEGVSQKKTERYDPYTIIGLPLVDFAVVFRLDLHVVLSRIRRAVEIETSNNATGQGEG